MNLTILIILTKIDLINLTTVISLTILVTAVIEKKFLIKIFNK